MINTITHTTIFNNIILELINEQLVIIVQE